MKQNVANQILTLTGGLGILNVWISFENGHLSNIWSKHFAYLSFNFGRSSSLLIVKLVVEALNVARTHVLAVQLLHLELVCVTNCMEFNGMIKSPIFFKEKLRLKRSLTTRLASRAVSKTALAEPSGLPSRPMLIITWENQMLIITWENQIRVAFPSMQSGQQGHNWVRGSAIIIKRTKACHLNRIGSFSEPISNLSLSWSIGQSSKVHLEKYHLLDRGEWINTLWK